MRLYQTEVDLIPVSPNSKEDIAEELADILWVVVCLANQTGVDLTSAFEASLRKNPSGIRIDLNKIYSCITGIFKILEASPGRTTLIEVSGILHTFKNGRISFFNAS